MRCRPSRPRPWRAPGRLGALVGFLLLAVLTSGSHRASAEVTDSERPVAQLEKLLEAVQLEGAELSFLERYQRLARIVARTHAIGTMTEARVGPSWRTLEPTVQKSLKDLLYKRIVAAFALRFDGRKELELSRGAIAEDAGGGRTVETRIRDADSGTETLRFRVRPLEDSWRIVNLVLDPDDDPGEAQKESAALLSGGGPDALVAAWKKKIRLPEKEAAPQVQAPREVIEGLQDEIIGVMKQADALGYAGRVERLRPLIEKTHHLAAIAQLTLRRHWKSLTEDQRRQFTDAFSRFAIARYAARFDGYSGERFETLGEEDSRSTKIVQSILVKSDGEKVTFDWTLRKTKAGWKILNITVDGVSDLATKQAEYAAIMEQKGYPGLIQTVQDQIRRQETSE